MLGQRRAQPAGQVRDDLGVTDRCRDVITGAEGTYLVAEGFEPRLQGRSELAGSAGDRHWPGPPGVRFGCPPSDDGVHRVASRTSVNGAS